MTDYVISCSSTADLTKEYLNKKNIKYACFHFSLDGKEYLDDMGESISPKDRYKAMINGAEAKTSQINVDEYIKFFTKFLEEGKDILHVSLSTGISGTFNSACIARDELKEKYPDRKIYIVDSLGASSGYGLIMSYLADKRDEGLSIDELYNWIEENKLKVNHWFFSTDLTFYIKGGRISKTAGFVGTVLNICPLLNMDKEGRLIPREKIRSKKKVIQRIVEKMKESAENGLSYSGKCYISHSDCIDDANAVKKLIEENFPNLKGKVEIFDIGATIGSHTGPGTVALFFLGKKRD